MICFTNIRSLTFRASEFQTTELSCSLGVESLRVKKVLVFVVSQNVMNLAGEGSRREIFFLVHFRISEVPVFPIKGNRIQMTGSLSGLSLTFVGLTVGANDWVSLLVNQCGKPFHDPNLTMFCNSSRSNSWLLHILWTQQTSDLSQATFLHLGVKLDRYVLPDMCGFTIYCSSCWSYFDIKEVDVIVVCEFFMGKLDL